MYRVIHLTGTPASNRLMDLWAPVWLLDRGERLGRTLTQFRERWFTPGREHYQYFAKKGAREEIQSTIGDICLATRAEDYLELPPRNDYMLPVELDKVAREKYDELHRHFLTRIDDEVIVAANMAIRATKCLQASNGFLYTDTGESVHLHDGKLDALEALVESANGQSLFVAYQFRSDLDRLKKRFPKARTFEDSKTLRDWNAGRIQMLLAYPASVGHGLNFQQGGHIVVWYGLTWSLEHYQQLNARLYRQGQTQPVFIYHLIAQGTMDERVMSVLQGKASMQDALMDALKEVA